jgi:hypothetical protein
MHDSPETLVEGSKVHEKALAENVTPLSPTIRMKLQIARNDDEKGKNADDSLFSIGNSCYINSTCQLLHHFIGTNCCKVASHQLSSEVNPRSLSKPQSQPNTQI